MAEHKPAMRRSAIKPRVLVQRDPAQLAVQLAAVAQPAAVRLPVVALRAARLVALDLRARAGQRGRVQPGRPAVARGQAALPVADQLAARAAVVVEGLAAVE